MQAQEIKTEFMVFLRVLRVLRGAGSDTKSDLPPRTQRCTEESTKKPIGAVYSVVLRESFVTFVVNVFLVRPVHRDFTHHRFRRVVAGRFLAGVALEICAQVAPVRDHGRADTQALRFVSGERVWHVVGGSSQAIGPDWNHR